MDKNWNKNIYYMIKCFSDIDRQKRVWLGLDNNLASSFDEDMSLLFDSFCFDDFILELKKDIYNEKIVKELTTFKDMLESYESKASDEQVLKDPQWFTIVEEAKKIIERWDLSI
ncbi:MAG: hypothetical protein R3342_13075 [Lutibacter sp.]|uniref:hypothetical protein n=1 Tax=Lutibacter sp. TaxID=1925666 RepID=UPI00299ED7A9|nr:hypothetical protein [Lutibacter sp.]MDX1830465.1 hypothetical protein [Lutibacter sp.]